MLLRFDLSVACVTWVLFQCKCGLNITFENKIFLLCFWFICCLMSCQFYFHVKCMCIGVIACMTIRGWGRYRVKMNLLHLIQNMRTCTTNIHTKNRMRAYSKRKKEIFFFIKLNSRWHWNVDLIKKTQNTRSLLTQAYLALSPGNKCLN